MILLIWAIAIIILVILWRLFVKGYVINWYGLAVALPGIAADLLCRLWIDVSGIFRRRKHINLDEFEKRLS